MKRLPKDFIDKYDLLEDEIAGHYCWFTCLRVDRKDVPEGFHAYDIGETDEGYTYGTIEKNPVTVNFGGTMVIGEELDFGQDDYIDIEE